MAENIEHYFAYPTGTLFSGHRGSLFTKVIQITTNKPLAFAVRFPQNANCEITIRDRAVQAQAPIWRTLTIMWVNVAMVNPAAPDEPPLDVQAYLEQVVPLQLPEVLIISSTGSGLQTGNIPSIMRSVRNTVGFQRAVGIDGGVFCASYHGYGNLFRDEDEGDNIQNGIELAYHWF